MPDRIRSATVVLDRIRSAKVVPDCIRSAKVVPDRIRSAKVLPERDSTETAKAASGLSKSAWIEPSAKAVWQAKASDKNKLMMERRKKGGATVKAMMK